MNPELQRNLWLEFTPSRVAIMTGVVALAAFAVFLIANNTFGALAPLGVGGFVAITLFWGTRNAARAVIGEIRERTWDFQRISAVSPISMTLGKLFGATSYTWYGGLLSLAIAVPGIARSPRAEEGFLGLAVLVASGVLAHAVALGSALATARRRRSDARLGILPHQAAGLVAALAPAWVIGGSGINIFRLQSLGEVAWYGQAYDSFVFILATSTVFALWAVVGCWREMRLELMESNRPIVWPAFLTFLAVFLAGFGGTAGSEFAYAYVGVHAATMIALLVEPKNAVELRAFGDALTGGRLASAFARLPAYGWGFLAAAVVAIAAMVQAPVVTIDHQAGGAGLFAAGLGFLARDIGVFLFFHAAARQNRGDFSALVALALLYVIGGAVANAVDTDLARAFVTPQPDGAAWAASLPWLEAAAVWFLALARFAGARRRIAAESARIAEA